MHVASRGASWDRAGRARVFSLFGRGAILLSLLAFAFDPIGPVAAIGVMLGLASMVVGFTMSLDAPRELPGEIEVDAQGGFVVRIGKRSRAFAREKVRGAWLVRRLVSMREYHWVEIATRSGTVVSIRVEAAEQGRALVEALGFGTTGRVVRIPLAKRTRRLLHLVLFAALYELLRFLFRPPILEIGNDAVQVGAGIRRVRILRERIARIVFFAPASLIIETKEGEKHRVLPLVLDPARVAAAAEIVEARLGDRPAPARANAFERGGRGRSGGARRPRRDRRRCGRPASRRDAAEDGALSSS